MSETPNSIPFESLRVERLKSHHLPILNNFVCRENDLKDFLVNDSLKNQTDRFSSTVLVFFEGTLVGYFTLINDCIDKKVVQRRDGIKHYRYQSYPALKVARLATNKVHEGRGIGTHMLSMVYIAYTNISDYSGCRFITVDAKIASQGFYEKFGFQRAKGIKKSVLKTPNTLLCNILHFLLLKICNEREEDKEIVPMYIDYHKILESNQPTERQLIISP